MKILLAAFLILAVGCAKETTFGEFSDATKSFSAQLPSNWNREGHDDLSRRPVAFMGWIAEVAAESEGQSVGAIIHISRFHRKSPPVWFKKTLDPTDAMFSGAPLPPDAPKNIESITVAGQKARRYRREFETRLGGGMHPFKGSFPMRLEDVVIQTPEAYYVLEYRATQALFDKHYAAFRRLVETFRLKD